MGEISVCGRDRSLILLFAAPYVAPVTLLMSFFPFSLLLLGLGIFPFPPSFTHTQTDTLTEPRMWPAEGAVLI